MDYENLVVSFIKNRENTQMWHPPDHKSGKMVKGRAYIDLIKINQKKAALKLFEKMHTELRGRERKKKNIMKSTEILVSWGLELGQIPLG